MLLTVHRRWLSVVQAGLGVPSTLALTAKGAIGFNGHCLSDIALAQRPYRLAVSTVARMLWLSPIRADSTSTSTPPYRVAHKHRLIPASPSATAALSLVDPRSLLLAMPTALMSGKLTLTPHGTDWTSTSGTSREPYT